MHRCILQHFHIHHNAPLQELLTSSGYMKIGDFPDEPIPPEALNPSKKPKSEDMAHILSCTGREVKKMLPDGNCLFRSLSFCLYRSQDRHLEIRKILVEFIRKSSVATDKLPHIELAHAPRISSLRRHPGCQSPSLNFTEYFEVIL